jgi:hypothetical protein
VRFVNARFEDASLPRAQYSAVFSASATIGSIPMCAGTRRPTRWRTAGASLWSRTSGSMIPHRRGSADAVCHVCDDRARTRR